MRGVLGLRTIDTEQELLQMLQKRPDVTTTYRVPKELLGRMPRDEAVPLRMMTDAEVHELSEYLEVTVEQLKGPFRVVEATCSNCRRRLTFLDFAKTAVDKAQHDRAQLRDVLTGKAGWWITIRGRDGGRPVVCAGCGIVARMRSNGYSEYSSSNYAYV